MMKSILFQKQRWFQLTELPSSFLLPPRHARKGAVRKAHIPLNILKQLCRNKRASGVCLQNPNPGLEIVGLDVAPGVGNGPVVYLGADELPVRPLPTGEERVDA